MFIDGNLNAQRYRDEILRPHVSSDCIVAFAESTRACLGLFGQACASPKF